MRTLTFSGASDDLVHVGGSNRAIGEPDEFGGESGTLQVMDEHGNGLLVHVHYTALGVWTVGIGPLPTAESDESYTIPDWPMTWDMTDRRYSAELTIEAPDSAVVTRMR